MGESAEGGSNQFLYQHARNFDWGMTSAVGIENRRWTVKLQYEMSLGKESKNDNIGVNYNSLTLSVGYKLKMCIRDSFESFSTVVFFIWQIVNCIFYITHIMNLEFYKKLPTFASKEPITN